MQSYGSQRPTSGGVSLSFKFRYFFRRCFGCKKRVSAVVQLFPAVALCREQAPCAATEWLQDRADTVWWGSPHALGVFVTAGRWVPRKCSWGWGEPCRTAVLHVEQLFYKLFYTRIWSCEKKLGFGNSRFIYQEIIIYLDSVPSTNVQLPVVLSLPRARYMDIIEPSHCTSFYHETFDRMVKGYRFY